MPKIREDQAQGLEKWSKRCDEVKAVIHHMDETQIWDSVQARDLDPKITDFVAEELKAGFSAPEIARRLGISVLSRQWKKIQAYFRQGFRADAEAYLYQQTHKYYKSLDQARDVLEEAFEHGTPHVTADKEGNVTVTHVKGATKELAGFIKAYGEAIALPVKLWKEYGAIGENAKQLTPGGVTILVQNNIPMPSVEEIRAHQEKMKERVQVIAVESRTIEEQKP